MLASDGWICVLAGAAVMLLVYLLWDEIDNNYPGAL